MSAATLDLLDAKRREQTPQALARLVVVSLFIGLWFLLWAARLPMPVPFLITLAIEAAFFVVYVRLVAALPTTRSIEIAHYGMLAAEIVFHTTIVYFLGGISWLGGFAYVFGLIFANTFLDLRRGLIYTLGASGAFISLILLEATGVVPHYAYLEQGALRYTDSRFVATTIICGAGVFVSIAVWVNWVGHQLRRERDTAIRTQEELLAARAQLQRANVELEERVHERTAELERANALLRQSEERFRMLAENARDIIFRYTYWPEPCFEYISPAVRAFLGYDPDDFYNDPRLPEHIVHPDDWHLYLRLFDEGLVEPTVLRWITKDGRTVWTEARNVAIRDEDGNLVAVQGVVRDITEFKRAEEALRDSEARLRAVVSSVPVVLFAIDREGLFTLSEGKGLDVLGLEPGQVVGQSVFDLYREFPQVLEYIQRALSGDSFTTLVDLDGITFETHYAPIIAATGEITGVIGVASDVTERKRAEEALRESEERLRTVVTNASVILFAIDRDGTITLSEGRGLEALGLQPGQMVGQSVFEVYQDLPEVIERARAALAGHASTATVEINGVVLEAHYSPVRGTDGEIAGLIGVATDITERKRAEEALRESETKFRTMAETVAAAAFIFQGERMKYVNSAAEEVTGYTRAELLRMDFWDVIHPDFRDLVRQRGMARQRGEPVPQRYEVKLLRKDGAEIWVDFTAGMIEFEGKPAVLGTAFDVTERKWAEQALAEQARLDPLTKTLNRRAGIAALQERLDAALAAGRPFGVLVLDIDRFKAINDTFGHEAGDAALSHFAATVTAMLGPRGVLCRVGGDEFEIGLDGVDLDGAFAFADELNYRLTTSLEHDDRPCPKFTVSAGIACAPGDGGELDDLSRKADRAMYAAKALGGASASAWRVISQRHVA